jgi:hypothetical protein
VPDGEKIGADMLGDMASLGLQELQAANAGEMAMDAPTAQPAEAPVADQAPAVDAPAADQAPSYGDMLAQQAAMSEGRGDAQDQGMSR